MEFVFILHFLDFLKMCVVVVYLMYVLSEDPKLEMCLSPTYVTTTAIFI